MQVIYGAFENDIFVEKYPFWVKDLVIDGIVMKINDSTSPHKSTSKKYSLANLDLTKSLTKTLTKNLTKVQKLKQMKVKKPKQNFENMSINSNKK